MTFTPADRARGVEKRRLADQERRQQSLDLPGGFSVVRDSPPGVGWILRVPYPTTLKKQTLKRASEDRRKKLYYLTREQALRAYDHFRTYGWSGWGPKPKHLTRGSTHER